MSTDDGSAQKNFTWMTMSMGKVGWRSN